MKHLLSILTVSLLAACGGEPKTDNVSEPNAITMTESAKMTISYPQTAKGEVVDTYFEQQIADPYRWLEDDRSAETEAWVKAQNAVTFDYLAKIPYREQIKQKLAASWNYEKVSAPFKEGKYTYFYKNDGLQNQYVLYRQLEDGTSEVFLDPNTFSADGTTSLAEVSFSKDGSKLAYSISEGGSDWRKIIVIDVETKQPLEPQLVDVKFSGINWYGNEGFYYSSYDKPDGSELSAKTDQHKLYYHKLGTAQKDDAVIFGGTDAEKHRYVGASVTEDDRYLLISAAVSTSGNKLFLKDLTKSDSGLITVLDHTDSDTDLLDNDGTTLYFVTNLNAPNKKVVKVDAAKPQPENWVDVIAQTDNVL
ncbi:MAG TPA: S9 family peptidase, partial [Rheinheimera sp.]|nr:S9 family peptidase [Rheinheimera sp.]